MELTDLRMTGAMDRRIAQGYYSAKLQYKSGYVSCRMQECLPWILVISAGSRSKVPMRQFIWLMRVNTAPDRLYRALTTYEPGAFILLHLPVLSDSPHIFSFCFPKNFPMLWSMRIYHSQNFMCQLCIEPHETQSSPHSSPHFQVSW